MAQFLVPQRSSLTRREGTLEEQFPPSHPVRFVWRILESFDFSLLEKVYDSTFGGPGRPPYHPRLLAALWIYGMTEGFQTAASIAEACTIRDDFRWLAGGLTPCDQTFLNFVSLAQEPLLGIWVEMLKAMHQAGHIDLSALAEDGTKLRANVSIRTFHTVDEIAPIIEGLKAELARKIQEIVPPETAKRHRTQIRSLETRLERARKASQEAQLPPADPPPSPPPLLPPSCKPSVPNEVGRPARGAASKRSFQREDFRYDPGRDIMLCPQGEELHFVGVYPGNKGKGPDLDYRVYERYDCSACALKSKCTNGEGRRLKIPVTKAATASGSPPSMPPALQEVTVPSDPSSAPRAKGESKDPKAPKASITDPEARLMMGGGSQKRIEPSYNADLTVTRHGVIVSQFLSNATTDHDHLKKALPFVVATLGRPDAWTGDTHYATYANLFLTDQAGVTLYAPMKSLEREEGGKFTVADFRHDPQKDVLVCPGGRELYKMGQYGEDKEHPYDVYRRGDCSDCALKARCTDRKDRLVGIGIAHNLLPALEKRMNEFGERLQRFRRQTVEPANSHLKQHGLGRLHVRGLSRCGVVLTLACIAHNLMKWKAREAARALKRAS
jgi:transposase